MFAKAKRRSLDRLFILLFLLQLFYNALQLFLPVGATIRTALRAVALAAATAAKGFVEQLNNTTAIACSISPQSNCVADALRLHCYQKAQRVSKAVTFGRKALISLAS